MNDTKEVTPNLHAALDMLREKLTDEQFEAFRMHFKTEPSVVLEELSIDSEIADALGYCIYQLTLDWQRENDTLEDGFDLAIYGITMMTLGVNLKEIANA